MKKRDFKNKAIHPVMLLWQCLFFLQRARGACRGAPPSLFLPKFITMGRRCTAAGVNSAPRAPGRTHAHSGLVVPIAPRRGDALFLREGRRWEERKGEERGRSRGAQRTDGRAQLGRLDTKTWW